MTDVTIHGRGLFPFGQPNTPRPMRLPVAHDPKALIVGVYPSAFHISWSPPDRFDTRDDAKKRHPLIGALAVDVEPVVFWDGVEPSPVAELQRWKAALGFDESVHGVATLGNNGPSGASLVKHILDPLGIDPASAAFTDVVPWFFVKKGANSQGEAMSTRFAPKAELIGVHEGSLPKRPTTRQLVEIAASDERRDSLRQEILDARAPLIITLGQEALDSVRAVADEITGVQARLQPGGYGRAGHVVIAGTRTTFMPLVHPGFRRQITDAQWRDALDSWTAIQKSH